MRKKIPGTWGRVIKNTETLRKNEKGGVCPKPKENNSMNLEDMDKYLEQLWEELSDPIEPDCS